MTQALALQEEIDLPAAELAAQHHLCMHGRLRDDPRTRHEFLSLTGGSR